MLAFIRRHPRPAAAVLIAGLGLLTFLALWFQPYKIFLDQTVSEAAPSARATDAAVRTLATGTFRPLDHDTEGGARLIDIGGEHVIRFDEDFRVLNGPDLVVWFSAAPSTAEGRAFAEDFVDLGRLKGNVGSQNYELPAGTDLARYRSVVVWCRRFGVGFAVAPLET